VSLFCLFFYLVIDPALPAEPRLMCDHEYSQENLDQCVEFFSRQRYEGQTRAEWRDLLCS